MADLKARLSFDFSDFDRVLNKASQVETKVLSTFKNLSSNIQASLGQAFGADFISKGITQLQKLRVDSDNIFKAISERKIGISWDTSFVDQVKIAKDAVHTFDASLGELAHAAEVTGSKVQGTVGGALKTLTAYSAQLKSNLFDVAKQTNAAGVRVQAGGTPLTDKEKGALKKEVELRKEQKDIEAALKALTEVLGVTQKLENQAAQIYQRASRIDVGGAVSAILDPFSKSGRQTATPFTESQQKVAAWLPQWIEQLERTKESVKTHSEIFEEDISHRLYATGDVPQYRKKTKDMTPQERGEATLYNREVKKQRAEIIDRFENLKVIRDEMAKLHAEELAVYEGPEVKRILEVGAEGRLDSKAEAEFNRKLESIAERKRALLQKYPREMEESTYKRAPEVVAATMTTVAGSEAEKAIVQLEKEMQKVGELTTRGQQLKAQIEFIRQKGLKVAASATSLEEPISKWDVSAIQRKARAPVTQEDVMVASIQEHQTAERRAKQKEGLEQELESRHKLVEATEEQKEAEEDLAHVSTQSIKQRTGEYTSLRASLESSLAGTERGLKLGRGLPTSLPGEVIASLRQMREEIASVPLATPTEFGPQLMDFSHKLESSVGQSTGFARREFRSTAGEAAEMMAKMNLIFRDASADVRAPFEGIFGSVKDLSKVFRIGDFMQGFEQRVEKVNNLAGSLFQRPAEIGPQLRGELTSLAVSLEGVGQQFQKSNLDYSEMANSFRIRPEMMRLHELFSEGFTGTGWESRAQEAGTIITRLNTQIGGLVRYSPQLKPFADDFNRLTDSIFKTQAFQTAPAADVEALQRSYDVAYKKLQDHIARKPKPKQEFDVVSELDPATGERKETRTPRTRAFTEAEELMHKTEMEHWENTKNHWTNELNEIQAKIRGAVTVTGNQAAVQQTMATFKEGLEPLQGRLVMTQAIGETLTGMTRLARGAGDVGHNVASMLGTTKNLVSMVQQATTTGLEREQIDRLRQMKANIDEFTVSLTGKHAPAVKAVQAAWREFTDIGLAKLGKFLPTVERGVLPETIRQTFVPPELEHMELTLEDYLAGMGRKVMTTSGAQFRQIGQQIFKPIGEAFNREYQEILEIPREPRKMTTAEVFGTGRFELIGQQISKVESYRSQVNWLIESLQTHPDAIQNFYQPGLKSLIPLMEYMEKLRMELPLVGAEGSPGMAKIALALDHARTKAFHTVESFKILKSSVDQLRASGGEPNTEWLSSVTSRLKGLNEITTKSTMTNLNEFMGRIREQIATGDPTKIYESVKTAAALPAEQWRRMFEIPEGMVKGMRPGNYMQQMPMEQLMQLKAAGEGYLEEVTASGFGEKTIARAKGVVGRLFLAINEEVKARGRDTSRVWESTELAPERTPSWKDQTLPLISKRQKSVVNAAMESMQEVEPSIAPRTKWLDEHITEGPKKLNETIQKVVPLFKKGLRNLDKQIMEAQSEGYGELEQVLGQRRISLTKTIDEYEKVYTKNLEKLGYKRAKAQRAARQELAIAPTISPIDVAAGTAVASEGDAIDRAAPATGAKAAGGIDKVTGAKKKAMERQFKMLQEQGVIAKEMFMDVEGNISNSMGDVVDSVTKVGQSKPGSGGIGGILDVFSRINNQVETFGFAVGRGGKPLELLGAISGAAKDQIGLLVDEFAKMSHSTETLDGHVKKFNKGLAADQKIQSFAQLRNELEGIRGELGVINVEEKNGVDVTKRKADAFQRLVALAKQYERTAQSLMTSDLMRADIHQRDLATIEQMGQAYRVAEATLKFGGGVGNEEARKVQFEAIMGGRDIAQEALTSSVWRTRGEASSFGSIFKNLGAPAATIDDLYNKVLTSSQTFYSQISTKELPQLTETFKKLSASFGLNIPESDLAKLDKSVKAIQNLEKRSDSGKAASDKGMVQYNKALENVYETIQKILKGLDDMSLERGMGNWAVNYTKNLQAARDQSGQMLKQMEHMIGLSGAAQAKEGIFSQKQARVTFFENSRELVEQAREMYGKLQLDPDVPIGIKNQFSSAMDALTTGSRQTLSLWERLTNTVKTTRNSFADLFMYQVRWYSSMLLFWGVFNKVGEVFKEMIVTQHQIERTTRTMRETTGELVVNYERLNAIVGPQIFKGMITWAMNSKEVGEALYQLGSAGLSAYESLAALGPALALARASEGDLQETTKTLAGLYNTMGDSIEAATSPATRFRIISDVMSQVFKDHQVEMSELNKGYQYSIAAADTAGLNFYELSAILGVVNDNMVKGSRAGRGFAQVLSHLAQDSTKVIGGFVQVAQHLKVDPSVYENLLGPQVKDFTVMELMREFSKVAKASGQNMEQLGKIFESFGMVGGRAMAPILLNFDKIDKQVVESMTRASYVAESMATRMSTTIMANMRRVGAYVQLASYDVARAINVMLTGVMVLIGEAAKQIQGLNQSIGQLFKSLGMFGTGTFVTTFSNTALLLTVIHGIFMTLPKNFQLTARLFDMIISKLSAIPPLAARAAAGLAGVGTPFITAGADLAATKRAAEFAAAKRAADLTPFAAEAAGGLVGGAAGGAVGGAAGGLARIFSKEFWSGAVSKISTGVGTFTAAIRTAFASGGIAAAASAAGTMLSGGIVAGLSGIWTALSGFALAHPFAAVIIGLSAIVAGITVALHFMKDADQMLVDAEKSAGAFAEALSKVEQQSVEAAHRVRLMRQSGETLDELTKDADMNADATKEMREAYAQYSNSVSEVDEVSKKYGLTVGDVVRAKEGLAKAAHKTKMQLDGEADTLLRNKKLWELYQIAVTEGMTAYAQAQIEKQRAIDERKKGAEPTAWGTIGLPEAEWSAPLPKTQQELKREETWARDRAEKTRENIINNIVMPGLKSYLSNDLRAKIEEMKDYYGSIAKYSAASQEKIRKELEERGGGRADYSGLAEAMFPIREKRGLLEKEFFGRPEIMAELLGDKYDDFIKEIGDRDVSKLSEDEFVKLRNSFVKGMYEANKIDVIQALLKSFGSKLGAAYGEAYRNALLQATKEMREALFKYGEEVQKSIEETNKRLLRQAPGVLGAGVFDTFADNLYQQRSVQLDNKVQMIKDKYDEAVTAIKNDSRLNQSMEQAPGPNQEAGPGWKKMRAAEATYAAEMKQVEMEREALRERVAQEKKGIRDVTDARTAAAAAQILDNEATQKRAAAAMSLTQLQEKQAKGEILNKQELLVWHKLELEAINKEKEAIRARAKEASAALASGLTDDDKKSGSYKMQQAQVASDAATKIQQAEQKTYEVEKKFREESIKLLRSNVKNTADELQKARAMELSFQTIMPGKRILTSTFNDWRAYRGDYHYGGDVSGKPKEPFFAPTDLTITATKLKMSRPGTGGMVYGVDRDGNVYQFHHVDPDVVEGQKVAAGTQLGRLSDIKGPHLDMKIKNAKGEWIDWTKNLQKGAEIKGVIPVTVPVKPNMLIAGQAMIDAGKPLLDWGHAGMQALKEELTTWLQDFKTFRPSAEDMEKLPGVLRQLEEIYERSGKGKDIQTFRQTAAQAYKDAGDTGDLLGMGFYENWVGWMKKAQKTDEEIRKTMLDRIKVVFEQERYWTKDNFQGMLDDINRAIEVSGMSGKKAYMYLFQEVFTTSRLKTMIESDVNNLDVFFDALYAQGKKMLGGGSPYLIMKNFQSVIREIISSGEELPLDQYATLVNTLARIPSLNLKESADAIAKYFVNFAPHRAFKQEDLNRMTATMRAFGATADEVWKAVGDVADEQIRRFYSSLNRANVDTKDSMSGIKAEADALWWAMLKGVADFASKIKDPLRMMADTISGSLEAVRGTLEEVLYDMATHQKKSWAEYRNSLAQSLAKISSKNLSDMIMGAMTQGIGKLLGVKGMGDLLREGAPQIGVGVSPKEAAEAGIASQIKAEMTNAKMADSQFRTTTVQQGSRIMVAGERSADSLSRIEAKIDKIGAGTGKGKGEGKDKGILGEGEEPEGLPGGDIAGAEEEGLDLSGSESVAGATQGIGEEIKGAAAPSIGDQGIFSGLWEKISSFGSWLWELVSKLFSGIGSIFTKIISGLGSLGGGLGLGMYEGGIVPGYYAGGDFISAAANAPMTGASVGGLSGAGSSFLGGLGSLGGIFSALMSIVGLIFGMFGSKKTSNVTERNLGTVYRWAGPGTPYEGPRMGPGEDTNEVQTFANGGWARPRGTDTVPAMLTPGEYVNDRDTVRFFGAGFFQSLKQMARQGVSNPVASLAPAMKSLQVSGNFQEGGMVPRAPEGSAQEMKITVVNVMDEKSVEEYLGTKKYGNVIVNKVGARMSRRQAGGYRV